MAAQIASAIGAFLILAGYFSLQAGKTSERSLVYLSFNFIGGSLLCYAAIETGNVGFIVLEAAWVGVTLLGFWKRFRMPKA